MILSRILRRLMFPHLHQHIWIGCQWHRRRLYMNFMMIIILILLNFSINLEMIIIFSSIPNWQLVNNNNNKIPFLLIYFLHQVQWFDSNICFSSVVFFFFFRCGFVLLYSLVISCECACFYTYIHIFFPLLSCAVIHCLCFFSLTRSLFIDIYTFKIENTYTYIIFFWLHLFVFFSSFDGWLIDQSVFFRSSLSLGFFRSYLNIIKIQIRYIFQNSIHSKSSRSWMIIQW